MVTSELGNSCVCVRSWMSRKVCLTWRQVLQRTGNREKTGLPQRMTFILSEYRWKRLISISTKEQCALLVGAEFAAELYLIGIKSAYVHRSIYPCLALRIRRSRRSGHRRHVVSKSNSRVSRATINNYLLPRATATRYALFFPSWRFFSSQTEFPARFQRPPTALSLSFSLSALVASFRALAIARPAPLRNVALLWERYFYGGLERGMRSHGARVCAHTRARPDRESWIHGAFMGPYVRSLARSFLRSFVRVPLGASWVPPSTMSSISVCSRQTPLSSHGVN